MDRIIPHLTCTPRLLRGYATLFPAQEKKILDFLGLFWIFILRLALRGIHAFLIFIVATIVNPVCQIRAKAGVSYKSHTC